MFSEIVLFGNNIILANVFNTLGNIGMFLWAVFHLNKYKDIFTYSQIPGNRIKQPRKKKAVDWILAFVELSIIFAIIFSLSTPVGQKISQLFLNDISGNFFTNIFAVPLEIFIICALLSVSPLRATDFLAPGVSIALIFYKIACFCDGCCYGVPVLKFGMYNAYTQRREFPVQLVEIICAVIMLIILVIVHRNKERKAGTLYPLFMMMYCASRFVSEFWRDDYPDILGPFKSYHLQCVIGFVEGALLMFIVLKFGDKITAYIEAKKQYITNYFCGKSAKTSASA